MDERGLRYRPWTGPATKRRLRIFVGGHAADRLDPPVVPFFPRAGAHSRAGRVRKRTHREPMEEDVQ